MSDFTKEKDSIDPFIPSQPTENTLPINEIEPIEPLGEWDDEFEIPKAPPVEPPFFGWKNAVSYFGFSQCGESHVLQEAPCQDRCFRGYGKGAEKEWHIFAISDGVGSCMLSDVGAQIAVTTAVRRLEHLLQDFSLEELSEDEGDQQMEDFLRDALQCASDAVEASAERAEQLLFSYQSTLTVSVYDGETLYFAHVGDDGIVALTADQEWKLITTRHSGAERHSLYPLQCKDAWEFGKLSHVVSFVMATDGVLDSFVAYAEENNRVFSPFLKPIVSLPLASEEEVGRLCMELFTDMQGEPFRREVTDDITITVVTNQTKLADSLLCARQAEEALEEASDSAQANAEQSVPSALTETEKEIEAAAPAAVAAPVQAVKTPNASKDHSSAKKGTDKPARKSVKLKWWHVLIGIAATAALIGIIAKRDRD